MTSGEAFGGADTLTIAVDAGSRLDALGVAWVIGGSMASSVHGEPRSTMDIDIVISLRKRDVDALVAILGADYYVDAHAAHAALKAQSSFNAVHMASAIKVDFFVAGRDPFEAERLASRMRIELPGGAVYVDTAEHTVLRKLEWYRRGGEVSERQWRDVQAIVRLQHEHLDVERMRKWAPRLGVADLLERVLGAPIPEGDR